MAYNPIPSGPRMLSLQSCILGDSTPEPAATTKRGFKYNLSAVKEFESPHFLPLKNCKFLSLYREIYCLLMKGNVAAFS